jgi:hypothetical protein
VNRAEAVSAGRGLLVATGAIPAIVWMRLGGDALCPHATTPARIALAPVLPNRSSS